MTVTQDDPQAGTILAGKFRVERVLGQGGMGVVVAAEHLELRQRVAVKCMGGGMPTTPAQARQLLREARLAARLQGEHVVRVTDVGTFESGAPFIVMEYLEGQDLAQHLREQGPLPVRTAVGYVLQVLVALAEAHRAGFAHRDIKLSNLFLARRADGSCLIKVLDFGISRAFAAEPSTGTQGTTAAGPVGSPHYMSPEQIRTPSAVDWRTDIWSVGVVLHELLTGARPFRGESRSALAVAVASEAPPPLRRVCPQVPAVLERVVLRCLEKEPTRRYATVAELAEALVPFAEPPYSLVHLERIRGAMRGAPIAAAAREPTDASGNYDDTASLQTFGRTWTAPRSSQRWPLGIASAIGGVAVVGGSLAVWLWSADRSVSREEQPPVGPHASEQATSAAIGATAADRVRSTRPTTAEAVPSPGAIAAPAGSAAVPTDRARRALHTRAASLRTPGATAAPSAGAGPSAAGTTLPPTAAAAAQPSDRAPSPVTRSRPQPEQPRQRRDPESAIKSRY